MQGQSPVQVKDPYTGSILMYVRSSCKHTEVYNVHFLRIIRHRLMGVTRKQTNKKKKKKKNKVESFECFVPKLDYMYLITENATKLCLIVLPLYKSIFVLSLLFMNRSVIVSPASASIVVVVVVVEDDVDYDHNDDDDDDDDDDDELTFLSHRLIRKRHIGLFM